MDSIEDRSGQVRVTNAQLSNNIQSEALEITGRSRTSTSAPTSVSRISSNNTNMSTDATSNIPHSPRSRPIVGTRGTSNPSMNHHSHTIPTRLHVNMTPTSIPPSPPFNPNINIALSSHRQRQAAPFVPNLNIGTAVPGSPTPGINTTLTHMDEMDDPAYLTLSSSPYIRATKSAVETALCHEKNRIRHLESKEASYTSMSQYQAALKRERQHSKDLVRELAALKSIAVASTLEAEVHEEGRINCLMRRLDGLQKEKGRIIVELEREEEMLTNTLQKKLNQVRREKAELQQQIEREHMLKAKLQLQSMQVQKHSAKSNQHENGERVGVGAVADPQEGSQLHHLATISESDGVDVADHSRISRMSMETD